MVYTPQALIIVHTRELANQVEKVITKIIKNEAKKSVFKNIKLCLIKAENYSTLQYGGQILITTPGVLKNLTGTNSTIDVKGPNGETEEIRVNVDLKSVKMIAVDEADEVYSSDLNANAITSLVQKMPSDIPILFLSATFTDKLLTFIDKNFSNRDVIKRELEKETLTVKTIKQTYLDVEEDKKIPALVAIFDKLDIQCQTVIFVNTKKGADNLQKEFEKKEVEAFVLHKDLGPTQRDKAINDFLDKKIKVLITTNLLSRGIDNRAVNFVINAELPTKRLEDGSEVIDCNTYLHRVGRTGRFDLEGLALNLVTNKKTEKFIQEIEKHFDIKMTPIEKLTQIDVILKEMDKVNDVTKATLTEAHQ